MNEKKVKIELKNSFHGTTTSVIVPASCLHTGNDEYDAWTYIIEGTQEYSRAAMARYNRVIRTLSGYPDCARGNEGTVLSRKEDYLATKT
jgi:hypothetical protein